MALNFPSSPVDGQTFSSGATTWTYDATSGKWIPDTYSSTGATAYATKLDEVTDVTGLSGVTFTVPTTYNRFMIKMGFIHPGTSGYRVSIRFTEIDGVAKSYNSSAYEWASIGMPSYTTVAGFADTSAGAFELGYNALYHRQTSGNFEFTSFAGEFPYAYFYGGANARQAEVFSGYYKETIGRPTEINISWITASNWGGNLALYGIS